MSEPKLYGERDTMGLDEQGGYFWKHVLAMTSESLHSKSNIAAELGYRDKQIDDVKKQLTNAIQSAYELLDIELHTEYESRLDELTRAGQEMGDYE